MMSGHRVLVGLAISSLAIIACGREPTAPNPSADLLGGVTSTTTNVTGTLLKCRKLPEYSASAVIGPGGGTLQIGPHTFTVPPGALNSPVLISADAPSDNTRVVNFQPQGLQFNKSASLTLSYAQCSLVVGLLPEVAYVDDGLNILSYVPSLNNLFGQTVTGRIDHFSGYATAW